jgi:host factor-I protein
LSNKPFVLQDVFLNSARRERMPVHVRMLDGLQLSGIVRGFDNFTLIIDGSDGKQSMLYKHAVAAVMPQNGQALRQQA